MSRSNKHPTAGDHPGVEKAGARKVPTVRPRSDHHGWLLAQRRAFGSTDKILRRNRKLWTRLAAKEGRQLDKQAVREGTAE